MRKRFTTLQRMPLWLALRPNGLITSLSFDDISVTFHVTVIEYISVSYLRFLMECIAAVFMFFEIFAFYKTLLFAELAVYIYFTSYAAYWRA